MQVAFPRRILIQRIRPRLEGLRHQPFVNVDGEPFSQPTLNGYWRIEMELMAFDEISLLDLDAFILSMRAGASTLLPLTTQWLPTDVTGRRLNVFQSICDRSDLDFAAAPMPGYTLRAAASHRDSYIDVNMPGLSRLRAGHAITLGERYHKVVNVTPIDELENAGRVSILPNLRGARGVGSPVIVDQLQLRCQMEDADDIPDIGQPNAKIKATFTEAF